MEYIDENLFFDICKMTLDNNIIYMGGSKERGFYKAENIFRSRDKLARITDILCYGDNYPDFKIDNSINVHYISEDWWGKSALSDSISQDKYWNFYIYLSAALYPMTDITPQDIIMAAVDNKDYR